MRHFSSSKRIYQSICGSLFTQILTSKGMYNENENIYCSLLKRQGFSLTLKCIIFTWKRNNASIQFHSDILQL